MTCKTYLLTKDEIMSDEINEISDIGSQLADGKIPEKLKYIKSFGEDLKKNPQKYSDLRKVLINAKDDAEKMNLLKGFVISEDEIRKITPLDGTESLHTIIVTTIIITTMTPGTAHAPEKSEFNF